MKVIEVDLIKESGTVYTRKFRGEWIINPWAAEYQYYDPNPLSIPIEGLNIGIALSENKTFLVYTYHKNGMMDPFMEEINSLEDLELELTEELFIEVKERLTCK